MRLTVTTSLAVLITCSMGAADLVEIEVVTALPGRALRELGAILSEVRRCCGVIRLLSVHHSCTSLGNDLSFLLVWRVLHVLLLFLPLLFGV